MAGTVVDLLVGALLTIPVTVFLGNRDASASLVGWVDAVALTVYVVVPTGTVGRTLGKLAAGTRVVRVDGGHPVGIPRALVRWLVLAGPAVVPGLPGWAEVLAVLWAAVMAFPVLTDPHRRGRHDRAAGTVVVVA